MPTLMDTTRLDARLSSVHASGRLADALLGIALDIVEPFASDYLSSADYDLLCGQLQAPITAATEAAVETLGRELALLADEDSDLARRIERAQLRRP